MYMVILIYSDLYVRECVSLYNLALILGPPSSTTQLISVPAVQRRLAETLDAEYSTVLTASLDESEYFVAVDEEGSGGTLERQRRASENQRACLESDSLGKTMDELGLLRDCGNEVSECCQSKRGATTSRATHDAQVHVTCVGLLSNLAIYRSLNFEAHGIAESGGTDERWAERRPRCERSGEGSLMSSVMA